MKKAKNTEKHIKDIYTNKLQVTTTSDLDKRVLANSMSTFDKVKSEKAADTQPNILLIIAKSRITQLAAAAVIITAISFVILNRGITEQPGSREPVVVAKSKPLAEMMTALSLNIAYRKGGIEQLERQCDEACQMLEPLPAQISVQELLTELIDNDKS